VTARQYQQVSQKYPTWVYLRQRGIICSEIQCRGLPLLRVNITTVIKTASYWQLQGHLQLYTLTNIYHAAKVGLHIVRCRDIKRRNISISSLAYDVNK